MGLFADILLEAVERGIGPQTDRGIVGAFAALSFGLALLIWWQLLIEPKTLPESWTIPVVVASLVLGAAGFLTSVLHLTRIATDRVFATLCLMANVGTMATGIAAIARL